ncbi:MAG: MutS-related protein [Thermoplasmata archaeon]
MTESRVRGKLSSKLLFIDRDFDATQSLPTDSSELIIDLGLHQIFEIMAKGDKRIKDVSQKIVLNSISEPAEIKYRQDAVKDSLKNRDSIRDMYSFLIENIEKARKEFFWFGTTNPEYSLHESISILEFYVPVLENIKKISESHSKTFYSAGFSNLFNQLKDEFSESYLAEIRENLQNLKFRNGVKVFGGLNGSCELVDIRLVVPDIKHDNLVSAIGSTLRDRRYTYALPERDESGYQELANIRNRSLISVSTVLRNVADNVLNFINSLAAELAFFIGCINLYEEIQKTGGSTCFPDPKPANDSALGFNGLYDITLLIALNGKVVTNDLPLSNHRLTLITGPNRGGKSTFLRSIGQALLLMKAGMFVGAMEFSASSFRVVYTHFKREEEKEMTLGKFDEELNRMKMIVNKLSPGCVVLFNESFSSTNALEGSQIAYQIIRGLVDSNVTVLFVTHLYELTQLFLNDPSYDVRFLVAERLDNGRRTFKVIQGKPQSTSYGEDLFHEIFSIDNRRSSHLS